MQSTWHLEYIVAMRLKVTPVQIPRLCVRCTIACGLGMITEVVMYVAESNVPSVKVHWS